MVRVIPFNVTNDVVYSKQQTKNKSCRKKK